MIYNLQKLASSHIKIEILFTTAPHPQEKKKKAIASLKY